MGLRHGSDLLQEVAQGLLQTLEGLRGATPLDLVEAQVEIPFAGTLTGGTASAGLKDFRDVSLLAEDIAVSRASDIWKIRVSIAKGHAAVLRVERYEAPAVS